MLRLKAENIEEYLSSRPEKDWKEKLGEDWKEEDIELLEIGDGNINYVYRLRHKRRKVSLVLKQSDQLLRSSGRPLDTGRSRIEEKVLRLHGELAPSFVPEVYFYDAENHIIAMEDLSDCENLRYALLEGKRFADLGERVGDFVASVSLPTTDLVLDRKEKKRWAAGYVNPDLCDITEDLVLSEPYTDYRGRNLLTEGNESFVEKEIYGDKRLYLEAGKLRVRFMNHGQALIHGDLHTGSLFVGEGEVRVIDPEFAFYGPIGYDLGNFIANLLFAREYSRTLYAEERADFLLWIEGEVCTFIDSFCRRFLSLYEKMVREPMAREESFRDWYLSEILSDAAGYAGTELIRRIVGDAKVRDLTLIPQDGRRQEAERRLILTAKRLILSRGEFQSGERYRCLLY
ncbi:MAG: S-methyl-5-thioribose kinase [Peptostreptococcaceae bacterium]|nr:S-methyl-5-thioribose kinase [Peptostreptococcaceae bacterium]